MKRLITTWGWFFVFTTGFTTDDSLSKSYYKELKSIHNPKTLTGKLDKYTIKDFKEFYISYSNKQKRVVRIDFIKMNKVEMTLEYNYEGRIIKKLKWTEFNDTTFVKCETDYEKKARITKCFNKKGILISEELYFSQTKKYSLTVYDSTGAESIMEYGKY